MKISSLFLGGFIGILFLDILVEIGVSSYEDLIKSKRENILLELDGFAKTHGSRKILDLAGQEKEIGNRYYASKRDVVVYKRLSREKEVPILVSEFLDEVAIGDDELEKLMKDLVLGQKREDFKQTYKQVSTLHKYK